LRSGRKSTGTKNPASRRNSSRLSIGKLALKLWADYLLGKSSGY
jgi:hypothetical protein